MVISVGYSVKSLKGTLFRRWATRVLKENTLKGVVYNDKQLKGMQEIHVDMVESVKRFDALEVLNVLNLY